MAPGSRLASAARAVVSEFREKHVTFLAGSIAYSAFVSLVPLLLFLVLALALLGGGWGDRFIALVTRSVSPAIGGFLETLLQRRTGSASGTSLVGVIVLVWAALKLFRGLDTAFGEIYEADDDGSLAGQLVDGVVVLLSLVVAVGALVAATTAFGAFAGAIPYLGALLPLALVVGLAVAFLPIYYVFPDVDLSAREVLPGVLVAAAGWALLQALFQVYVALAAGSGEIDILTGVMLLLTYLYAGGVILLLGAVVNAVIGGYTGQLDHPPVAAAD